MSPFLLRRGRLRRQVRDHAALSSRGRVRPGVDDLLRADGRAAGFESVCRGRAHLRSGRLRRDCHTPETGRWPLPVDCEIPDPLELLTFLAARTERIVLATGILVAAPAPPVDVAKRLSTVDVLSGGRMRLGVGVGWMREELEAIGVDFDTAAAAWTRRSARSARSGEDQLRPSTASSSRSTGQSAGHDRCGRPASRSTSAATRRRRHGAPVVSATSSSRSVSIPTCPRPGSTRCGRAADGAGRGAGAIELTLGGSLAALGAELVERLRAQGADRILLSATTDDLNLLAEQMASLQRWI
ncbi:MAG: LLM class flavin-dependent oxidoreductase [Acidimicrobiales bacterium]